LIPRDNFLSAEVKAATQTKEKGPLACFLKISYFFINSSHPTYLPVTTTDIFYIGIE
jgi:hypothetical protein